MGARFEPDAVIEGRYRVDRLLGRGGMGEVWAAVELSTGEGVALKVLLDEESERVDQHDQRRRFLREMKVATAVFHPNIVRVREVFETSEGSPVMVMDLLRGEPLDFRLAREGRLSAKSASAILAPIISATGTLHEHGIIHRDLKPANIFLAEERDGVVVKLLDFGVAKLSAPEKLISQSGSLTSTGALLGTPFYMAPEQCAGERDIDHRADIWALGIILYECLTGVRPTAAENLGQVIKKVLLEDIPLITTPGVPDEIRAVVRRMLARDREARIADLREVLDVLTRHAEPEVHAPSFGAPARVKRDAMPSNDRGATPSGSSISATSAPSSGTRRGLALGGVAAAIVAAIALTSARDRAPKSPASDEQVKPIEKHAAPIASASASVSARAQAPIPSVSASAAPVIVATAQPSSTAPPAPIAPSASAKKQASTPPAPAPPPTPVESARPPLPPPPINSVPQSPTPFVKKPPF